MTRSVSIGLLLALARVAKADDPAPEGETIVIVDRAPDADATPTARDRDRALGDAPFITIVHADDHPATQSVADALGTTAGVQSRSLGGAGAYGQITVRGAAPGHTAVLVDGVPLARLASVTQDIGRFTLDAFDEIELYRGAVPVELGGAGVGGALNMVTRLGPGEHGERVHASAGAGSFGARHLRLHHGDAYRDGKLLSSATFGYQAATGDYSFFSNNGTPLNAGDDVWLDRRNNEVLQLDGSARLGTSDRSSVAGVRASYRTQGLPGSATQPSYDTTLSTLDVIGDGRFDARVGRATARQLGYIVVENQRLRDPDGEIGLGPQDRGYFTLSGGAQTTWSIPFGRHRATAGVELRGDRFRDEDRLDMRAPLTGDREGGAAHAAVDLVLDPDETIVVTPSIRFDVMRTAPAPMGTGPTALAPYPTRWDSVPSPRLSARALVTPDVAVKASAGYYVRLPTLVELFGNRGTLLGSPDLRPERGPSMEAGVVWAPSKPLGIADRILVEASTFGTRSRDTIAFITTFGYVARAMNVANSQTYGGELVASLRLARIVSITANYTRLVTQQLTEEASFANKSLPREPGHAAYMRIDAQHDVLRHKAQLWLDARWQSETYLDQANLVRIPSRTLIGGGTRVEVAAGVAASLTVENALDVRLQHVPTPMALADIAGFPLPGRTVYLSLDWSY